MWQRTMLALAITSSGCVIQRGTLNGPPEEEAGLTDARADARADAWLRPDADLDAYSLFDVPPDAVVLPDTGEDAGTDAGFIIPPDAPPDAAMSVPIDAWSPPDAPTVCTTGALRCNDDNTLGRCESNAWVTDPNCDLGCARTPAPRCRVMVPSTVAASEMNGTVDVDLAGGGAGTAIYSINTSACSTILAGVTVRVSGGFCVYAVRSLRVRPNATLEAVGNRPLIVLATGDINVETGASIEAAAYTLQHYEGDPEALVNGRFFSAGAGASLLGRGGNGVRDIPRDSGGVGGGFCTNGGAGGNGVRDGLTAAGGISGSVAGPADIGARVLRGGGSGGNGSDTATGGGGGGALQLSARGRLTVNGFIIASGGAGEGGVAGRAGGGGGSGGMILAEATTLALSPGSLVVRGGGGGGGGCVGRDSDVAGSPGTNGIAGTAGGTAGRCSASNAGGNGGSASSVATPAAVAGASEVNAGGGGGGAGCVSIRRIDSSTFDAAILPNVPGVTAFGPLLAE